MSATHSKTNKLKKTLNTKQMNKVQAIRIKVWKYKATECLDW